MRTTTLLLIGVGCLLSSAATASAAAAAPAAAAAAEPREQWLIQTRAADAIGEVLMAATARGEPQVALMRRELPKTADADADAPSPAPRESQAAYRELLNQVAAEVQRGDAAGQIDPSFENLGDGQLFGEMAALHSYNLRTFRRLGELRGQATEVRRRLEAGGKWKGNVTTRPAIETPDAIAREAIAALKRPQRSLEWSAARQKMRNAIATSRAPQLRGAMQSVPPPSPHAPPAIGMALDDPRWQRYYYGPGDQFGGWGEELYGDAFNFRGGGGVYKRHDTRVNSDYDTRTRGQSDRRINVESDRRLNIHVDPRENF